MIDRILFCLTFLVFSLPLVSRAQDTTSVSVPQAGIDLNQEHVLPHAIHTYPISLSLSNWTPNDLSEPSYLYQTTPFQKNARPTVSLNLYNEQPIDWSWIYLNTKLGFSYLQMSRTGYITLANQTDIVSQTMNVYAIRMGIDFTPHRAFLGPLIPFVGLSFLPTLAIAPTSAFNEGTEHLYWATETSAGLLLTFTGLAEFIGMGTLALEVGTASTHGIGAPFSGAGTFAGIRIGL